MAFIRITGDDYAPARAYCAAVRCRVVKTGRSYRDNGLTFRGPSVGFLGAVVVKTKVS